MSLMKNCKHCQYSKFVMPPTGDCYYTCILTEKTIAKWHYLFKYNFLIWSCLGIFCKWFEKNKSMFEKGD